MQKNDALERYDFEYINKLSLDQLIDIQKGIDQNNAPEQFKRFEKLINKKKELLEQNLPDDSSEKKIILSINFIKKIYIVLILLGTFYVLYSATGLSDKFTPNNSLRMLPILLINITIYFGLRFRKSWIIYLILFYSAIELIRVSWNVLIPANDLSALLITKLIGVAYILFYGYQVYFFSRPEVKRLFSEKGMQLF